MTGQLPQLRDIPIGIEATGERTESDAIGEIAVPADRYWGAQTQRSLHHFSIGRQTVPPTLIHAYGRVKEAAAKVNMDLNKLEDWRAHAIIHAAREVALGKLDDHFPLFVWQTGSGTQTNMNVNEVIANRAIQLLGGEIGAKDPVHPNDHVNKSQSSNDSFPTAMHVSALLTLEDEVLPALRALREAIVGKAEAWMDDVKIGRTHLMDAVPMTAGQEWSGYATQLGYAIEALEQSRSGLLELAQGGTAVGTGLNAPEGFSKAFAEAMSALTGKPFITAPDKFEAQSSVSAMVTAMAALRGAAVAMLQIANNVRFLASGPRSGLGELSLPENEPGSSIMPGKVNPTQCEAIIMVCTHIIGLDNAVAFASAQGNFQLNTMRPMIIANYLDAASMLSDACTNFRKFLVEGVELNKTRMDELVARSLMLVTALAPVIGYDKASQIAHKAHHEGTTLREAALELGYVDEATFDRTVDATSMTGSGPGGA